MLYTRQEKTKLRRNCFFKLRICRKRDSLKFPGSILCRVFDFVICCFLWKNIRKCWNAHEATIKIANQHPHLHSIALDKLNIGKALMLQAVTSTSVISRIESRTGSQGGAFAESEDYLNQAVDDLREAGCQDDLPRGLLACATLYRHQKKIS